MSWYDIEHHPIANLDALPRTKAAFLVTVFTAIGDRLVAALWGLLARVGYLIQLFVGVPPLGSTCFVPFT